MAWGGIAGGAAPVTRVEGAEREQALLTPLRFPFTSALYPRSLQYPFRRWRVTRSQLFPKVTVAFGHPAESRGHMRWSTGGRNTSLSTDKFWSSMS